MPSISNKILLKWGCCSILWKFKTPTRYVTWMRQAFYLALISSGGEDSELSHNREIVQSLLTLTLNANSSLRCWHVYSRIEHPLPRDCFSRWTFTAADHGDGSEESHCSSAGSMASAMVERCFLSRQGNLPALDWPLHCGGEGTWACKKMHSFILFYTAHRAHMSSYLIDMLADTHIAIIALPLILAKDCSPWTFLYLVH